MTTYTTHITADKSKYPVLLSNGNLVSSGDLEGDKHFAEWHDPHVKPCYLFAMVAGDLTCVPDSFTTVSGKEVELRIYVQSHNAHKRGHAMASLKVGCILQEKSPQTPVKMRFCDHFMASLKVCCGGSVIGLSNPVAFARSRCAVCSR